MVKNLSMPISFFFSLLLLVELSIFFLPRFGAMNNLESSLYSSSFCNIFIRDCRIISKKGIIRLVISQRSTAFTYDVRGRASEMLMKSVVKTSSVVTFTVAMASKSDG